LTVTDESSNQGLPPAPSAESRGADARTGLWRRWHLGALVAHVGLSIFFTWPLALNLLPWSETMLPGVMLEDRDQNLWNLWWVRHALLEGRNPFVTDFIWYPTGVSLYYHTLNVFNGLLAIPLLSVFSLPLTYNIIVMFSFVVGGYGAFLLAHYVCGNRWAALAGSVVFAYSAYHIATMRGLLQLISLEWVPFFVLFLLQAVFQPAWRSRGDVGRWLWRRALPAGFALFLVTLVDWYYTMYCLMIAGLLALYILLRSLWRLRRGEGVSLWRGLGESWARIAVCLALYLLLASPILVPTLREMRSSNYMNPGSNETLSNSADLMAFFQPPRDNKLWGRLFTNRREWPFGSNRYEVYLTYTALFLAGVGLFAAKARRPAPALENGIAGSNTRLPSKWFWAGSGLVFFLLALGPVLQVNGQQVRWLFSPEFKLPMPYSLIQGLPVVSISRSPDRFDMPLTLCLGVLSGYGVNTLMKAWQRGPGYDQRGAAITVGAVALISLELAPMPYPHQPAPVPSWYHQLGKEAGDFTIFELPPQNEYWHGAFRMYFQTAHEKRIFGGYISREFPHPFVESTPGYRELTSPGVDMFASGPDEWLSALALYRTRYVVLQKVRLMERNDPPVDVSPSREAIVRVLGSTTTHIHSDDQLEVYAVPSPSTRVPFLSLGEGWQPAEEGPNGTFRWMGDRATLRIDSPGAEESRLTFRAAGLGEPRPLQIFHGDVKVFDAPIEALQQYRVGPLGLPAGAGTLTFVSPEGTISPLQAGLGDDPRELSFALLDVKLEPVGR